MTRFLLTTDPGIEDLVAEEALDCRPDAAIQAAPHAIPGLVLVETDEEEPLLRMTTIRHVIELRGESEAGTLEDVRHAVSALDFPELAGDATFRVTSRCSGDHAFTQRELAGAAGAAIQQRHGSRVDLTEFDVNIRVDLAGKRLIAGVQRTRESLDKRIRRPKALRTSIKPTTAAAMVRLAGAHRGPGRLIDPLCGSGTIPVEAKRINPELDVYAADWDRATTEVARGTLANHRLAVEVRVGDARSLRKAYPEPFDYIVTDPPYGVRLGKRWGVATLYRELLPSFRDALVPEGRIVMAVLKFRTLSRMLGQSGLAVVSERAVGAGDLRPRVVVLHRS